MQAFKMDSNNIERDILNSTQFIILISITSVIVLLLIVAIIFFSVFFYKKNQKSCIQQKVQTASNTSNKEIEKLKDKLNQELSDTQSLKQQYENLVNEYRTKLKNLANMDDKEIVNQYKQQVYDVISPQVNQEVSDYIHETRQNANNKASEILVGVMERLSKPLIQEKTTTSIKIPNETLKARIIGKEGRNKKSIENLTGTDLIIEKDNEYIVVSSANPIRREITIRMLQRIFESKSIESTKIENIYYDEVNRFNEQSFQYARNVIFNELKIVFENQEIYNYLGRLKYRSSYGQNTLSHLIECAKIAAAIAEELKINPIKAAKAALLHDIGKSMDYELDKNHVDLGVEIATNLGLEDYIINAIHSHHDEVVADNIYSQITKIADSISASRPGARINSYNEYFERIQELEKIVNEFDEVNSCYAIRSGRYVRIIANPTKLKTNDDLEILAYKIKKALENNPIVRKYKIKVALIKENKFEFETSTQNEEATIYHN